MWGIYETNVVNGMFELLGQALFAPWATVVFKIKCYKLGPWQVFFGVRWMNVWL
jgi:hypothetical protein